VASGGNKHKRAALTRRTGHLSAPTMKRACTCFVEAQRVRVALEDPPPCSIGRWESCHRSAAEVTASIQTARSTISMKLLGGQVGCSQCLQTRAQQSRQPPASRPAILACLGMLCAARMVIQWNSRPWNACSNTKRCDVTTARTSSHTCTRQEHPRLGPALSTCKITDESNSNPRCCEQGASTAFNELHCAQGLCGTQDGILLLPPP
jgi:hypothetical protein